MASTDIIESYNSSTSATYLSSLRDRTKQTGGLTINTETFLKLLVAQLQYQDPLEPQTDTAFVAQLAQMGQLETMQSLMNSYSSSQALAYVGKYVIGSTTVDGAAQEFSGIVDSIVLKGGKQYVLIGDNSYLSSEVSQVFDPGILGSMNDAMNLVGKYARGFIYEWDAEAKEYVNREVSGQVTGAERSDTGLVYVIIGDDKIAMSDIDKVYTSKEALDSALDAEAVAKDKATQEAARKAAEELEAALKAAEEAEAARLAAEEAARLAIEEAARLADELAAAGGGNNGGTDPVKDIGGGTDPVGDGDGSDPIGDGGQTTPPVVDDGGGEITDPNPGGDGDELPPVGGTDTGDDDTGTGGGETGENVNP